MEVYACIAAVSAEIAQNGIAKSRKNLQQGYVFRGIDDVLNALAPLLSKHGLVIIPRVLSRELIERQSKTGGPLFTVTVEAEFDFVAVKDGSKVTARSFGEAMDSADKATNKAMSAAYKYTAFQTFCIPTEGDNDADAQTHDVAAAGPAEGAALVARTRQAPAPKQPALTPPQQRAVATGRGADLLVSEAQAKRFHAKARDAGWKPDELQKWLKEVFNLDRSLDIPRAKYDEICKEVERGTAID